MTTDSHVRTKSNSIYFAVLIGVGFLWTGTAYMVQAYRMLRFLDGVTVNLLVCGVYYVCQAAGIGAVAILFTKRPISASGRGLPLRATILSILCLAATVYSSSVPVVIAAGTLMNVMIGVLSGCYLTRLSTNVVQQRRGIVFGGAYAFGSIGTWLLSLPEEGMFLWSSNSLYAVAALAFLSLLFLTRLSPLPARDYAFEPARNMFSNKMIIFSAAVVFLMCTVYMLGFSFPLKSASGSVYIEFTRAFYAVGLIIAGVVNDKNRRWGAICCLAALAFPFAALALGGSTAGETLMWVCAYIFLGFFSSYRILIFSDISGKIEFPAFAVIGLLAGRLGEAAGTAGRLLTGTPLIVFSGIIFAVVIALFFPLYQKLYAPAINTEESERRKFTEYAASFALSAREQEILAHILRGMSTAEMAGALYITESTVKFHIGNIFKDRLYKPFRTDN